VGLLTSFSLPGCRCWFYSGDHRPPHVHAGVADEWEIRVFILQKPVQDEEVVRVRRIPGRLLRTLLAEAEAHREDLFREWERNRGDD
jgi:hypothetical protein